MILWKDKVSMIDHHISQNDHITEEELFNKIRDIKGAIMTNANEIKKSLIQNYKTYIHGTGRIVLWLMYLLHRHEGCINFPHPGTSRTWLYQCWEAEKKIWIQWLG